VRGNAYDAGFVFYLFYGRGFMFERIVASGAFAFFTRVPVLFMGLWRHVVRQIVMLVRIPFPIINQDLNLEVDPIIQTDGDMEGSFTQVNCDTCNEIECEETESEEAESEDAQNITDDPVDLTEDIDVLSLEKAIDKLGLFKISEEFSTAILPAIKLGIYELLSLDDNYNVPKRTYEEEVDYLRIIKPLPYDTTNSIYLLSLHRDKIYDSLFERHMRYDKECIVTHTCVPMKVPNEEIDGKYWTFPKVYYLGVLRMDGCPIYFKDLDVWDYENGVSLNKLLNDLKARGIDRPIVVGNLDPSNFNNNNCILDVPYGNISKKQEMVAIKLFADEDVKNNRVRRTISVLLPEATESDVYTFVKYFPEAVDYNREERLNILSYLAGSINTLSNELNDKVNGDLKLSDYKKTKLLKLLGINDSHLFSKFISVYRCPIKFNSQLNYAEISRGNALDELALFRLPKNGNLYTSEANDAFKEHLMFKIFLAKMLFRKSNFLNLHQGIATYSVVNYSLITYYVRWILINHLVDGDGLVKGVA
jgi:hypothetical protein